MRRLILSDIHGNQDALHAVLHHAEGCFDEVVCCGDIVGYGACPAEVLRWVRDHAAITVRGNHDRVCAGLDDAGWFNEAARRAVAWTRSALSRDELAWLRDLPAGPIRQDGFVVAHGSPDDEDEYLLGEFDVAELDAILDRPLCFVGHTHVQRGWVFTREGPIRLPAPLISEQESRIVLSPGRVYLVNPGSVGQPRDHDPRAAYLLWDEAEGVLTFRRVAYDIEAAQRRIRAAGLPAALADRLALGR